MRVTWLFYHFFKLQVHILHSLENISIFNIWKLWLVSCDVIFSGTSLILPKMSENFWSKEIPLRWFPDSTLKLNNSRTTWPISAIYISFSSILNALSYEINLFSRCSSPLSRAFVGFLWPGGVDSTSSRKQCYSWAGTMKLGTGVYLPKYYPCAKFGCHSLINDVTVTSSMLRRQRYPKVLRMFVNQVLFRHENVASNFFTFWNAGIFFITFWSKNSQISN